NYNCPIYIHFIYRFQKNISLLVLVKKKHIYCVLFNNIPDLLSSTFNKYKLYFSNSPLYFGRFVIKSCADLYAFSIVVEETIIVSCDLIFESLEFSEVVSQEK